MEDLTPEERAVVLAMRQSEMAGDAIFNYAVGFDEQKVVNPDASPYVRNRGL